MHRVLVLEDDEVSAQLLAGILQSGGFEPLVTAKCAEAWTRLKRNSAELLILDTNLNGENGCEFLEQLRGDVVFSRMPVIVYSSITQRGVIQKYLKLGVQGMLVKPYAAERLHAEVGRLTQVPWHEALFEPVDSVRKRAGFTGEQVAGLYRDAIKEIERTLADIAVLARDASDPVAVTRLGALRSCAINVGCSLITRIIDKTEKAARDGEFARVASVLQELPIAANFLRNRADALAPLPPPDESAVAGVAVAGAAVEPATVAAAAAVEIATAPAS